MFHTLFFSCEKATVLSEQKLLDGALTFTQEIQLAVHLRICKACRLFSEQSKLMDKVMNDYLDQIQNQEQVQLSAERKSAILNQIQHKD